MAATRIPGRIGLARGIAEQGHVPRGGGYSRKTKDVPVGDSGKFESGKRAPSEPGRGRRTAQERKAFKERTKETRRKIKAARKRENRIKK